MRRTSIRALGLAALLLGLAGALVASGAREILVVVNTDSPATTLTGSEVRRIFLRKRLKWDDDLPIQVFERHSAEPIRREFARGVTGMSLSEQHEHWMELKVIDGLEAPRVMSSAMIMKHYLKSVRGGIGYLYPDELDDGLRVVYRFEAGEDE